METADKASRFFLGICHFKETKIETLNGAVSSLGELVEEGGCEDRSLSITSGINFSPCVPIQSPCSRLGDLEVGLGWVEGCPCCLLSLQYPLSLSPSRFYPVSRRVPEYYSPYSSQYPDDYQYYPPGVRPESICSMPAYDRISPPWALEDKRHAFRNGGGPAYQLREWKEPASYGRQDGTIWIPSPSRQPVYYDELDAASSSMRRLSLQPRSHSVPRSPSQGSYSRARIYSPVRSPSARFERLPPRSEDIYADPAAYVMRRSISSPKVSHQPAVPSSFPEIPRSLRQSTGKRQRCGSIWATGPLGCVSTGPAVLPREAPGLWFCL